MQYLIPATSAFLFKEPWHFNKEVPGGREKRPEFIRRAQSQFHFWVWFFKNPSSVLGRI
ncbi:unnamed protein product [marine sediment metagenome]|uniref:Uncharacterized protein n=1 Tax=marine sediment metagenome TaxID=412755 RepID=X1LTY1_9ZZZZ